MAGGALDRCTGDQAWERASLHRQGVNWYARERGSQGRANPRATLSGAGRSRLFSRRQRGAFPPGALIRPTPRQVRTGPRTRGQAGFDAAMHAMARTRLEGSQSLLNQVPRNGEENLVDFCDD
jgi:hypothetical protein